MPRKLALWLVLLIVGFLTGFILQYARLQQVQQELSGSTKQLGSCQASEQLSQLRDTATVMFLEAVQKNYGKAVQYSKEFFDQAQRIQSSTEDPALRNLLRDTLATRDLDVEECVRHVPLREDCLFHGEGNDFPTLARHDHRSNSWVVNDYRLDVSPGPPRTHSARVCKE
jgi:hypothetical protein